MSTQLIGGGLLHKGGDGQSGRPSGADFALRVSLLACAVVLSSPAPASAVVWFTRAKASGDGSSPSSPIGSTIGLDAVTRPGDIIILLASDEPLDGGLTLKADQTLIGQAEAGRKPAITNSNRDRNGGNGVVLGEGCKVVDVRVERTEASGILGVDVSGTCLIGVEVEDANLSAGLTTTEVSLLGRVSHAGILFLTTRKEKVTENRLLRCRVNKAAGIGIGSFSLKGARTRLIIGDSRSEGGALIPPLFDMGVAAFADGKGSESDLEITDSVIASRMSQQGRNLLVMAAAGAKVKARVERSRSGECGQDGIVGVATMVPATVEVEIRDSTLEKAGQMNLEGTILNLTPSDPERAHESLVSIDVVGSVIRDAGFVDGFRGEAQNVWLAPSMLAEGPFAKGHYRLAIRDSVVEGAVKGGITIGNDGSNFKVAPDGGQYEVLLHDNAIRDNGTSEIAIAAGKARIEARRNFWGSPAGLAEGRVILLDEARRSQLDASEPLARPSERLRSR
ncbi:hypothetical protein [Singulisphaera sp. PoT]|uniref:hypothetical protein n=1 Tax=Singulisphaera sp. PoT TaxID=3411797 RepID=UPI003BF480BB